MAKVTGGAAITAPKLLAMDSRGARLLGAFLVGALAISVTRDLRYVESVPLLILGMAVISLGVGGILRIRSDPMSAGSAALVAATGPIGSLLTCLAIPGPLGNSDQTNALGAGVVIAAFLCVRGRIGAGWCSWVVLAANFVCWSALTGQGALYGLSLAGPTGAVLGMATLFARVMRPAAVEMQQLHEEAIRQAEEAAAADARRAERARQRARLRAVAWPILMAIGGGGHLSAKQVEEIRLTEAELREGARAQSLSVSPLIETVRAARSRGVKVIMFDDGGFDAVEQRVRAQFLDLARAWVGRTDDGTITLRVHPPKRAVVGSIVVVHRDGLGRDGVEVDSTGLVQSIGAGSEEVVG